MICNKILFLLCRTFITTYISNFCGEMNRWTFKSESFEAEATILPFDETTTQSTQSIQDVLALF